jgi:hypothetical protein
MNLNHMNKTVGLLALACGLVACTGRDRSGEQPEDPSSALVQGATNDGGATTDGGAAEYVPCALRRGTACAAPCVPTTGRRFVESKNCFAAEEAFKCDDPKPECAPDGEVFVRDAVKHYWKLNTKCVPPGWSALAPNEISSVGQGVNCN